MRIKNNYIVAIMLSVLFLFALVTGGGVGNAYAAATSYSGVLEDLEKDENFNGSAYVKNESDYSLNVFQIAESVDKELFVYVYQPSSTSVGLMGTSIVISQSIGDNISPRNYGLVLIDSYNVFYKYKVEGLAVKSDAVRYYEITSISRRYNPDIDNPPADGQTIKEVPLKVVQQWTAYTVDGEITYTWLTSEAITIKQKVVGYCTYADGFTLGWGTMDGITKAYFVAFSTDKPIDKLISADLTFYATRAHCKICLNRNHTQHSMFYDWHDSEYIDYGTGVYNNEPLTITDKQEWGNVGGGNVRPATRFLQKRIRKTEDFIADNNNKDYQITSSGADKLDGTQWVLNFYEAQDKYCADNVWLSFVPGVNLISGVADGDCELNNVFDVQILRLEFETEGKPYNLGVVDNKQTGNEQLNEYIGSGCNCLSALPWWAWLLFVLLFPLIVYLVVIFIKWLITLPFRKIRERRKRKKKEQEDNAQNGGRRKNKKTKNNSRRNY